MDAIWELLNAISYICFSIKSFGKLNSVRFGNSWTFCQIYLFHFKQPKDWDIIFSFMPIKKINALTRMVFYHNKKSSFPFSHFHWFCFSRKKKQTFIYQNRWLQFKCYAHSHSLFAVRTARDELLTIIVRQ